MNLAPSASSTRIDTAWGVVGPTHMKRRTPAKAICKERAEMLQSPVGVVFKNLHAEMAW
jgi:hypothetical protein